MLLVKFKFDKHKDIWNYWSSANEKSQFLDFSKFINPELLKLIKGKTQKEASKIIERNLSNIHNNPLIKIYLEAVSKAWKSIEKKYFENLVKITKKPICSEKFTAYTTTTVRCPYEKKENWFMINFFSPIPHSLKTIGHEIMHFQFYKYYFDEIEKEIGKEKTEDLKEALTVLLNLEFRNLWLVEDKGYPKHEKLREFIEKEWKKEPDFENLLEKCVEFLKNKI